MVHRDALTEASITIFFSKKRSVTASSIQKRVNKGTKKSQMEYTGYHKYTIPTCPKQVERTKLSRKVFYYFTMFAIIKIEILTFKDSRIRASARPTIAEDMAHSVYGARVVRSGDSLASAPFELTGSRR